MLYKYKLEQTDQCDHCKCKGDIKHLFFDCKRVKEIWLKVGDAWKWNIQWKHLVLGCDISNNVGNVETP